SCALSQPRVPNILRIRHPPVRLSASSVTGTWVGAGRDNVVDKHTKSNTEVFHPKMIRRQWIVRHAFDIRLATVLRVNAATDTMTSMYETSTILIAFGLTLLAGLSTAIGGAIAVGRRSPGPGFLAASLGLSAGVMLYVSFMEILPEGTSELAEAYGSEKIGAWAGAGAFFAGIAIIGIIDRLVPESINPHEPGTIAQAERKNRLMKTGVFTAGALAIHNFPEGFATFLAGLEDMTIAI